MPGYGTRSERLPSTPEFEERKLVRMSPAQEDSTLPNCASNEIYTVPGGFPIVVTTAREASIAPSTGPHTLKRHTSDATGERWQRSVSAARSPNRAPLASALFRSSRSNSA